MNEKAQKSVCICGCGRSLKEGMTGRNFATPACVLRVMLADKRFSETVGAEHIQTAIDILESKKKE